MPFWLEGPIMLTELVFLLIILYIFFLIIQLALFNLVILGILIVFAKKIFQFVEAIRWKCRFSYRTKEFTKFIKEQNETVYSEMKIRIEYEREGSWLEFLLIEDENMFEQMIADRRERIFRERDNLAIEEMKKILNDYTQKKDEKDNKDPE